MALELAQWRASVGYDRAYRVHCQRYGLLFHLQLEEDGVRLPTAVEAEAEAVKNLFHGMARDLPQETTRCATGDEPAC